MASITIEFTSTSSSSVLLVGNAGAGTVYRMAAWSAEHGTCGHIPSDVAAMIATDVECRSPRRVPILLKRMVKHGMLTAVEGGYAVTIPGLTFHYNQPPEPR